MAELLLQYDSELRWRFSSRGQKRRWERGFQCQVLRRFTSANHGCGPEPQRSLGMALRYHSRDQQRQAEAMFCMLAEEHSAALQAEIATSKLARLAHDDER